MVVSDLDIARGIVPDLAFDGKKAAITDIVECRKIFLKIHASRAERYLFEIAYPLHLLRNRMNHTVNIFRIAVGELYTCLLYTSDAADE